MHSPRRLPLILLGVVGAAQTQTCRYKLVVSLNTSSDLRVWGCEQMTSGIHQRGDTEQMSSFNYGNLLDLWQTYLSACVQQVWLFPRAAGISSKGSKEEKSSIPPINTTHSSKCDTLSPIFSFSLEKWFTSEQSLAFNRKHLIAVFNAKIIINPHRKKKELK